MMTIENLQQTDPGMHELVERWGPRCLDLCACARCERPFGFRLKTPELPYAPWSPVAVKTGASEAEHSRMFCFWCAEHLGSREALEQFAWDLVAAGPKAQRQLLPLGEVPAEADHLLAPPAPEAEWGEPLFFGRRGYD